MPPKGGTPYAPQMLAKASPYALRMPLEAGLILVTLFNSHRFRQVPRLVDVASAPDGDVIRE
jgi:hypothetical protein